MTGTGWVLVVASVTVAANAGVFVAFSTFVMRALGDLPAADAVRAMQSVNRRAPTPAFMALLVGSTVLAVVGAVAALVSGGRVVPAVAGAVLAVVAFAVTGVVNVPLNDRLEAADPADGDRAWSAYAGPWTRANHARAALGLLAALLLAVAAVPA
ncbi:anthrone oxygenase family protein [Arthrobacter sp. NEB 688]|uniref:anthrone oxygenase family protein n=1 Tax=Arthrobacter sp. NEB 688 TaxID=904039 RepID=UPI001567362D|nr:anthrone oxygenase family protein [Arthrobacter sp. NEB 688]QKE85019.1 DUF1772 domain-containing protein [Arthrobacter sp. NEB 688]